VWHSNLIRNFHVLTNLHFRSVRHFHRFAFQSQFTISSVNMKHFWSWLYLRPAVMRMTNRHRRLEAAVAPAWYSSSARVGFLSTPRPNSKATPSLVIPIELRKSAAIW
jgi:hypothetical protein